MKQVRFTSVVEQSGKPEVYLLLTDPKKDPDFQAAMKANRVMTIAHGHTGGKTSSGQPGYAPGPQAQVLVFPRALKIPDDAHVVGINFDLLNEEHEPVKEEPKLKKEEKAEVAEAKPKPAAKSEPKGEKKIEPKLLPKPKAAPPAKKVIQFEKVESNEKEEREDLAEIKADIRRAMKALEAGKEVAAFNILKQISEG